MSKAARHDAEDPILLGWARQFLPLPRDQRAGAILRFVQRCIRYERDPAWFDDQGNRHGIELLDSAAVGLHRAYGDCDLKARVFVALCLACGVKADIEPVFTGKPASRMSEPASSPRRWRPRGAVGDGGPNDRELHDRPPAQEGADRLPAGGGVERAGLRVA